MTNTAPWSNSESFPEELIQAIAKYERLLEETRNRDEVRRQVLEQYPRWDGELHQHFRVEDRLLGVTDTSLSASQNDDSTQTAPAGDHTRFLPRYCLGVGGQGEVWLAHDPELDRFVALKVIKASERDSQQTSARFWREAELTGKLEHPNIVPVYEAGHTHATESEHSPYYVMRAYGNRHFLRAITAFHARSRTPEDRRLLQALQDYQGDKTPENKQRLEQALNEFPFDEAQQSDRDLQEAIAAFRQDPDQQSGRSLHDAIQAYHQSGGESQAFRELLTRFIDICNAMAYAHSRGVLHRDLKPQNVMLGEFGETLVVDWGLAKVIGRPEEYRQVESGGTIRMAPDDSDQLLKSQIGSLAGTLAFMPPEQAWGRVDELQPAADIYCLGGILYAILTGKPPRSGSRLMELLEAAREGRVVAPSSVKSDLPKALEAICLKALSKAPSDRYATAKDLAADVGRWLADEPVSAWKEPAFVRARRWVKHHQTLVGSTAAAVLVAVATLSAMVIVVSGKNDDLAGLNNKLDERNRELSSTNFSLDAANSDLETANQALIAANQREADARLLAEANEREAERQRDAAQRQSQLALSTLSDVIFDLQRSLANLPGGGEIRRRLLETSLEKLEQVATEYVGQASVDRNTFTALSDMGDVILKFGVGEQLAVLSIDDAAEATELTAEQQSAVALAESFYTRAHDIAQALVEADPTNAQAQRDLSVSYIRLGDVGLDLGDAVQARAYYQQSLKIHEALAAADPTNAEAQRDLSIAYERMGRISRELGDTAMARRFYQHSLGIREVLAVADPTNVVAQRDLSFSYDNLGDVTRQFGDSVEARALYQQSLDIREALATADPANAEVQRDLSISYERLGDVSRQLGDTVVARAFYQQSLDISEELAAADSTNAEAQRDLSIAYNKLGDVSSELGDTVEARALYQQSLDIREALAAADPTNAEAQRDLSVSFERLGNASRQLGDTVDARAFYQQSLDIREALAAADPTNASVQRDLSYTYNNLGNVARQLGDTVEARAFYQQGLVISEALAVTDPTNAQAQRDLTISYFKLARTSAAMFDYDTAIEEYGIAIAVLDAMISNNQNVEQSQRDREVVAEELRAIEDEAYAVRAVLAEWDEFITQPAARSQISLRITHLARSGRFDEIPQSAEMLRSLDSESPVNLYNAARGYALCAGGIQAVDGDSLTDEQLTQRQLYIDLALTCLHESIAAGYSNFEHMQQDSDLDALHDLPEFEKLINPLEE